MTMVHDIQNLALVNPGDKMGHAIIALTAALVARGWVVRGSGDGAAAFQNLEQTAGPYSVFTSGAGYVAVSATWDAAAPNTITKARAWIRLKEPGASTREIILQRSSSASGVAPTFMVARMAVGGYTGSGATALSPPTAPGGDFGFASTSPPAFNATGINTAIAGASTNSNEVWYFNAIISDSARAGNVWPFYFFIRDSSDQINSTAFVYESLVDIDTTDTHPFVIMWDVYTNTVGIPKTSTLRSFFGRNPSGGAFQLISSGTYVFTGATYPGNTPEVGADNNIRALQVPWMTSTTAPVGVWKGHMEHIVYNLTARDYPLALDYTSALPAPHLYAGQFLIPGWAQNVVPR